MDIRFAQIVKGFLSLSCRFEQFECGVFRRFFGRLALSGEEAVDLPDCDKVSLCLRGMRPSARTVFFSA